MGVVGEICVEILGAVVEGLFEELVEGGENGEAEGADGGVRVALSVS